jgi:hypothetical protein
MAKVNMTNEKDGKKFGCILDTDDPLGEAVCYLEDEQGRRINRSFDTEFDEEVIKVNPKSELRTPDGMADPAGEENLHALTKKNLPFFQQLLEAQK